MAKLNFPLTSEYAEKRFGYPQKSLFHQWIGVLMSYVGWTDCPENDESTHQFCRDLLAAEVWVHQQVPQPTGMKVLIYEDGDQWCACFEGFESPPEHLFGFGGTMDEALGDLHAQWQEAQQ